MPRSWNSLLAPDRLPYLLIAGAVSCAPLVLTHLVPCVNETVACLSKAEAFHGADMMMIAAAGVAYVAAIRIAAFNRLGTIGDELGRDQPMSCRARQRLVDSAGRYKRMIVLLIPMDVLFMALVLVVGRRWLVTYDRQAPTIFDCVMPEPALLLAIVLVYMVAMHLWAGFVSLANFRKAS